MSDAPAQLDARRGRPDGKREADHEFCHSSVAISGSYGGMNLGDEAILESLLGQLCASLPADITVLSRNVRSKRRSPGRSLRCAIGYRLLEDVGVSQEIHLTADPAFLLDREELPPGALKAEGVDVSKRLV